MTKKKKTKMPAKTPSAYDRFYPKVEKDEPKKRSKKNEFSDEKGRADEGNKSPETDK